MYNLEFHARQCDLLEVNFWLSQGGRTLVPLTCVFNNEDGGFFFGFIWSLPIQIFVIKYWGLPIDNPQYPNIL
jgi:hypothetical protein